MKVDGNKGLMQRFVDFLNEKGKRKKTHHEELLSWDDEIRGVVRAGAYPDLTESERSAIHRKSALVKQVGTLAANLLDKDVDPDICAWLSAALEGRDQRTLRCGLLEAQIARVLWEAAGADFRVVDVPDRPGGGKRTDFALARRASVECKRLTGSVQTLRDRLEDADSQHAAMRDGDLDANATCATVVSLAHGETPETIDPKLLDELKVEAANKLAELADTDAVLLVVESWRDRGDHFLGELEVMCVLKPGRTPADSLPEELRPWSQRAFLTVSPDGEVVGMFPSEQQGDAMTSSALASGAE